MTKLPILYSRTNTGAIETWEIIVDGGSFYSRSGQLNGKITQNLPTVCLTKNAGKVNETSPYEQAQAEALAKWTKKLKLGYFEEIEDIDNFYFVEPMLATSLTKIKGGVKFPALLQCKFNGVRCIATKDGLFSRKGERFLTVPHIEESLKPFFEKHPEGVLDGEIFCEALRQNLNELMSIVRRTVNITPAHHVRSKELASLHVYDGYGLSLKSGDLTENVAYSIRKEAIDKEIISGAYPSIVPAKTTLVRNEEEMWAAYNELIDDNHEGAIIRYGSNTYEHKRSRSLIKIKEESDGDAIIVDIQAGLGNWAGKAKIITLNWKGIVFDASTKGSMAEAEMFLSDRLNWIGKTVEFKYNDLTGLGVPNFARVDVANCLKS